MNLVGNWLNSPFSVPIFITAFAVGFGVIGWVLVTALVQWRKTRVAAYNAKLKQVMIERGMSADEIQRILEAGGPLLPEDDRD